MRTTATAISLLIAAFSLSNAAGAQERSTGIEINRCVGDLGVQPSKSQGDPGDRTISPPGGVGLSLTVRDYVTAMARYDEATSSNMACNDLAFGAVLTIRF